MTDASATDSGAIFVEDVLIEGHIVDSLILPKILDEITTLGGTFEIENIRIGQRRADPSSATLKISADSAELLETILTTVGQHGAVPVHQQDCQIVEADMDGAFPVGFYCTTNQDTQIRIDGNWIDVDRQEMDCGIRVSADGTSADCLPMCQVAKGDRIVIGRLGVRVIPLERELSPNGSFAFMNSAVSSEKPKGILVRDVAAEMRKARQGEGKILVVGGPAIVHTGSSDHFSTLIREGYVDVLFAGNALATHDIEQSFFGTSLGISMERGNVMEEGHEHHLRSINAIRRAGGIEAAVRDGSLSRGIMYECVQHNVPFVLAGSIRDDGPLPEVITDALEAQQRMRELVQDVTFCLMIATTLHSIAVGNLLPARVKVVCVDINPATVTKPSDRWSFQTVGLVTDVEPFLRFLVNELHNG